MADIYLVYRLALVESALAMPSDTRGRGRSTIIDQYQLMHRIDFLTLRLLF